MVNIKYSLNDINIHIILLKMKRIEQNIQKPKQISIPSSNSS